jgi:hypothetical protein
MARDVLSKAASGGRHFGFAGYFNPDVDHRIDIARPYARHRPSPEGVVGCGFVGMVSH